MSTRKRKAVYNSQQVTSALLGENTLKVSPNDKDNFGKDVKLVKKPVSEMKTLNYKKTKAEDVVIDLKKGKFRRIFYEKLEARQIYIPLLSQNSY